MMFTSLKDRGTHSRRRIALKITVFPLINAGPPINAGGSSIIMIINAGSPIHAGGKGRGTIARYRPR